MTGAPIVFLDRDGVLNEVVAQSEHDDPESPLRPDDVRLIPRAAEGLRTLRQAGFSLVVASNQPAAAKGEASVEALLAVHSRVAELIDATGAEIDEYLYCFHHPHGIDPTLTKACDCRKPKPGLLLRRLQSAAPEDIARSWMVGDADTDVVAGQAATCRTVLIENPLSTHRRLGVVEPTARAQDLVEAAAIILARL